MNRKNRFINTKTKNYVGQTLITVRLITSLNRCFIKLIIISFILYTLFGNVDIKSNSQKGVFFNRNDNAGNNGVIVEKYINYPEQVTNRFSRTVLAANNVNSNVLADLVSVDSGFDAKKANNVDEKKSQLIVFDNNSIVSDNGYQTVEDGDDKIINYVVEDGDTPCSIADSFGITTNTVLWANNLKNGDYIRPGDILKILPISGVEHKISTRDTLGSIAKKYNANIEDIIVFNSLPANGEIKAGESIIIPNGAVPAPPQPKIKPKIAVVSNNHDENVWINPLNKNISPANSHKFPWGQCTFWVAKKRYVPWGGDAKRWLNNAPAYGFKTGKVPVEGAIVITTEDARYGHVAYVEKVNDGTITISEMNYKGLGAISQRVLPITSRAIRGYIY